MLVHYNRGTCRIQTLIRSQNNSMSSSDCFGRLHLGNIAVRHPYLNDEVTEFQSRSPTYMRAID